MDLLSIIKKKVGKFSKTISEDGLEAVVNHIVIAESHYDNANNGEEHLYTDVVYRTNQAFEGAVNEAYRLLAGGDPNRKRPYEIEAHFDSSNILRPRVLFQLSNYRKEWRNKSTHDYTLDFNSQEAILAIVSVTAFFNILLDQMLEKISSDREKEKLSKNIKNREVVEGYNSLDFKDQCVALLRAFSSELKNDKDEDIPKIEFELIGRISGFITSYDNSIEIGSEIPIDHASGKLQVDLLLTKGGSKIIVEVKRPSQQYDRKSIKAEQQVKHYLAASNLTHGIVFAPVLRSSTKYEHRENKFNVRDGEVNVVLLTPAIRNA
ncbi:MAG: hypothetical protein KZQ91_07640 [Candidatus Thiodiazotropha sp. (ex Lucinoma borealis)]|nr:hypothetical protein [Candidatus Thiodiazotropha sp. (ex Lucinoma borealis)]